MKGFFRIFALLAAVALLSSCSKNQFSLEGNLSGGETQTITLIWRAASGTQDFIAQQPVPLTGMKFSMQGPVKKPSVIWVFSTGRNLMAAIYVERGNKLSISGAYDQPQLWNIKGNKVMEEVSAWQVANKGVLVAGNPAAVNGAVAAYVRANPKSRAAAFLLLTRFHREADKKLFDQLIALIPDKDMLAEMRAACLEPNEEITETLSPTLQSEVDSIMADKDKPDANSNVPSPSQPAMPSGPTTSLIDTIHT